MAGVYKAGTLYVDVVPSMKGFFKTVEADAKAQLPNIGQSAGKDFANGLRAGVGASGAQVAKSISQPLDAAASDVKNSVNAMTRGLQASTSGMQRAADGAGRSLSTMGAEAGRARGPVDSAARALDGAASSAGSAAGSMREAGSGFSSMTSFAQNAIAPLAALAAAVGIGGFVTEAIAASDATQKFADTLNFAGIDPDRIEELGAAAQKYADETVYDLSDIQGITAQLAANNVKDFDKLAEAAGNLNAVAGGSAETYKQVGLALVQVNGAGKLATQDWNQIANAIPGASGKIQKALLDAGAYTGNFREAMTQGQISAEEFNEALLSLGFDEVAANAARDTSRIENAAGNLQATIMGGVKELVDYMKPTITDLMGWLSGVFSNAFGWIKEHKDLLVALGEGIGVAVAAYWGFSVLTQVITWIKNTTLVQEGLNAAMAANPIGLVVVAIGALVAGLIYLYNTNEDVANAINALGSGIAEFWTNNVTPVIDAFVDYTKNTLVPSIESAWGILTTGDYDGNLFGLEEDSALVDFFFTLRESLLEVGEIAYTAWTDQIKPSIEAAWDWISGTLWPGLQDFWSTVLQPLVEGIGSALALAWTAVIRPTLMALWTIISRVLWPVLQTLWENVVKPLWEGFASAVQAAWAVIYPAMQALAGFFRDTLMPALWSFWQDVVEPVWTNVSSFILAVWDNVLYPLFDLLATVVSGTVGLAFQGLWTVVVTVWNGISSVIQTAWSILSPIFSAIGSAVSSTLGPVFTWLYDSVIQPVWNNITSAVQTASSVLIDVVFPAIKSAIDGVKNGFESFRQSVETVFDKVKGAAAKPINFVITTVYRDGIKAAFDTIAEKVGLSTRLPTVNPIPGYATGGVFSTMTPGYSPGKDIYHFYSPDGGGALRLSGGEGIIRPDALRALGGKPWLDRVNASRGSGLATVGETGRRRGEVAFADGGVWNAVKGGFSSALSWVKETSEAVADIVSDPAGAVVSLVIEPAKKLLAPNNGDFWEQIIYAAPTLWFDAIKDFFTGKVEASGLAGGAGLVGAAMKAVLMGVPYVWGGSSIPPGLDCSGLVYWAAQQLGLGWPRLTAAGYQSGSTPIPWGSATPGDLLYWGSPAWHVAVYAGNGQMIEEPKPGLSARKTAIWGSPSVGRYGGARKYDRGGWLPDGVTAAVNQTGQREAILTARQWADVSALAASGAGAGVSLEGAQVQLILDDGAEFRAHVEGISAGVLARRKQFAGRSR